MKLASHKPARAAWVAALLLAAALATADEVEADKTVVTQIEAMNDADCTTSKHGDWTAWAKTLAGDYVNIEADGSRQTKSELLASLLASPPDSQVENCATQVDRVMRDGSEYRLDGVYLESGTIGPKHQHYIQTERIRDSWRQSQGSWVQTESLAYEATFVVEGRVVSHKVSAAAPALGR